MKREKEEILGFDHPTNLPQDEDLHRQWQEQNRAWWNEHPMRYDWKESVGFEEFSAEFFQEVDRRFFSVVRGFMPWKNIPFDPLIDFDSLGKHDVLEIGVGIGSHAQLLAQHAKSYTGIDITSYAVQSTSKRMKHIGLNNAAIIEMDAEKMEFDDNSFDYIWTWGVIDHSANTERILKEMARVLRPSGRATVMVYHRGWWNYYFVGTVFHGILRGGLLRTRSLHKTVQEITDGAFSRYYSPNDWRTLSAPYLEVDATLIYGQKSDLFPIPGSKFKSAFMGTVPDAISRFLTNRCHMGGFLVSKMKSVKDV